jgi:hypothetical protein
MKYQTFKETLDIHLSPYPSRPIDLDLNECLDCMGLEADPCRCALVVRSEHSSFNELQAFVRAIRPRYVTSTARTTRLMPK